MDDFDYNPSSQATDCISYLIHYKELVFFKFESPIKRTLSSCSINEEYRGAIENYDQYPQEIDLSEADQEYPSSTYETLPQDQVLLLEHS